MGVKVTNQTLLLFLCWETLLLLLLLGFWMLISSSIDFLLACAMSTCSYGLFCCAGAPANPRRVHNSSF